MFLINTLMEDISVGTAGLVALLGYAVVFIGLIALMAVIMIVGKIMVAKKAAPAAAPAAAAAAASRGNEHDGTRERGDHQSFPEHFHFPFPVGDRNSGSGLQLLYTIP